MSGSLSRRVARERKDDAALGGFGDAAGAFAEIAFDDVGLPEVRAARVKDERLTVAQLMVEQPGEARIPALSQARRHAGRVFLLGVVVDVEVIRFQDLEVELLVLNLVAAEVAALCRDHAGQRQSREREYEKRRGEAVWQSHG